MSQENRISVSTAPIIVRGTADDEMRFQIDFRLRLDEVAESEATQLRASARRMPDQQDLCRLAGRIYDARRAREKILDVKLFGEPAWDMLLALYCLPGRGEIMTITSLSYAASIPQTTGLRWQKILTDEDLIERGPQGVDMRKQMVRLTKNGRILMDRYLTHLFYCDTPGPEQSARTGG